MGTRKKRTIAQEVDMAAKLLQRYVRLKASDDNGYCQCVSCGKVAHYATMDGGSSGDNSGITFHACVAASSNHAAAATPGGG